jgi:hypothetical protein
MSMSEFMYASNTRHPPVMAHKALCIICISVFNSQRSANKKRRSLGKLFVVVVAVVVISVAHHKSLIESWRVTRLVGFPFDSVTVAKKLIESLCHIRSRLYYI